MLVLKILTHNHIKDPILKTLTQIFNQAVEMDTKQVKIRTSMQVVV